ncbi:hypothetical protein SAMN05444392_11651 [Seinonella peptonophila]|uniref:Uncharacterized protein n=1 Tax=Seinonella peptonophila TaxID=112248 RepID=A0A1M5AX95_9BACL|nr:hypothetical protein [Seinonella peptonophila]SHF34766.1 hypothetical protein SAMN05444392_11651 [Seinonella peptonophila]
MEDKHINRVILRSLNEYQRTLMSQQEQIQKSEKPYRFSNALLKGELIWVEKAQALYNERTKSQSSKNLTKKMQDTRLLLKDLRSEPEGSVMGISGDYQQVQVLYKTTQGFILKIDGQHIWETEDLEKINLLFATLII